MNIFSEVLNILGRFLLPVLIIILILTIVNIVLNYMKYGTRIFSSFKRYDLNGTMKKLVIDILKNENRKGVLIVNRDENSFYAITNYDVFAILIFDCKHSLSGSSNDEYLNSNNEKILNPIPKFLNDNKEIMGRGINFKTMYINTKKDVKLNIEDLNGEIYTLKDFSYNLYQKQHSNSKYSNDEMVNIQKEIEDIINGNN